jgi:hypothetical protein
MTAPLSERACHCRPGITCLTCAAWARILQRVQARRAAWKRAA